MDNNIESKVDQAIINNYKETFGEKHVVIKSIEEMGELIQVLSKWLDNPNKVLEADICEEISHVNIFVGECLPGIFSKKTINYYHNERVSRLLNKVDSYQKSLKNGKNQ